MTVMSRQDYNGYVCVIEGPSENLQNVLLLKLGLLHIRKLLVEILA